MLEEEQYLIGYWNKDKESPKVVFSQAEKDETMDMFIISFKPVPKMTKQNDDTLSDLKRVRKDLKNLSDISRRLIK